MTAEHFKAAVDTAFVPTAVTAPWWLEYLNTIATSVVVVTGAMIGVIRLWIAIRDLRNKR